MSGNSSMWIEENEHEAPVARTGNRAPVAPEADQRTWRKIASCKEVQVELQESPETEDQVPTPKERDRLEAPVKLSTTYAIDTIGQTPNFEE